MEMESVFAIADRYLPHAGDGNGHGDLQAQNSGSLHEGSLYQAGFEAGYAVGDEAGYRTGYEEGFADGLKSATGASGCCHGTATQRRGRQRGWQRGRRRNRQSFGAAAHRASAREIRRLFL